MHAHFLNARLVPQDRDDVAIDSVQHAFHARLTAIEIGRDPHALAGAQLLRIGVMVHEARAISMAPPKLISRG